MFGDEVGRSIEHARVLELDVIGCRARRIDDDAHGPEVVSWSTKFVV
jgi:hypothetical protein